VVIVGLSASSNYYDRDSYSSYGVGGMMGLRGGWSSPMMGGYGLSSENTIYKMRDILHFSDFTSTAVEKGVEVSVTSEKKSMIESIQDELVEHEQSMSAYFTPAVVKVEKIDKGIKITLTSTDDALVKNLQKGSEYALSEFLMTEMMNEMGGGGGRR
jgi:hypothetical protein